MKSILENFVKRLDEFKKAISEKGSDNLKKLEDMKARFGQEIDQYLESFYKKRDQVREALKKRKELKKYKIGFWKYITGIKLSYVISAPFIYAMIIPAVVLHVFLEIYHHICFPLYGIKTLKARNYFVFDRHHLGYLNWFEKLNCLYCSYLNCLISYTREIAGLTELYWCPIKHARMVKGSHKQYYLFVEYLEGNEYRKNKEKLRKLAQEYRDKEIKIKNSKLV